MDAIQHGPLDVYGTCPWCHRKVDLPVKVSMPRPWEVSELTDAYEQAYDPDYGSLSYAEIRHRMRMGLK